MIILKALQWPYKTIIQHHTALNPHFLSGHLNIICRSEWCSVIGRTIHHTTSHHGITRSMVSIVVRLDSYWNRSLKSFGLTPLKRWEIQVTHSHIKGFNCRYLILSHHFDPSRLSCQSSGLSWRWSWLKTLWTSRTVYDVYKNITSDPTSTTCQNQIYLQSEQISANTCTLKNFKLWDLLSPSRSQRSGVVFCPEQETFSLSSSASVQSLNFINKEPDISYWK